MGVYFVEVGRVGAYNSGAVKDILRKRADYFDQLSDAELMFRLAEARPDDREERHGGAWARSCRCAVSIRYRAVP